jgi:hypothetical protein
MGVEKMGRSNISGVLNDFFKDEYEPTIWDLFHLWEKKAWRQLMPLTAFNNGQEYGPP